MPNKYIFWSNFNWISHQKVPKFKINYQCQKYLNFWILETICFLKCCPIFDGVCESQWKSYQNNICLLLIFFSKIYFLLIQVQKTPPLRSRYPRPPFLWLFKLSGVAKINQGICYIGNYFSTCDHGCFSFHNDNYKGKSNGLQV